jgi:hypothetical protein
MVLSADVKLIIAAMEAGWNVQFKSGFYHLYKRVVEPLFIFGGALKSVAFNRHTGKLKQIQIIHDVFSC